MGYFLGKYTAPFYTDYFVEKFLRLSDEVLVCSANCLLERTYINKMLLFTFRLMIVYNIKYIHGNITMLLANL